MTDVAEGRRQEWRFCLVFALLSMAIFAVLYAGGDGVVRALNHHIAWMTALVLGGLGISAGALGAVVSAGGFAVEIKNNCNAIYEFGLYAAAVGAYPASLRAKAAGLLVGAGVLYVVNTARVISLMALGLYARDWFEVSHLYVWQALFFATIVSCWFGWILRLRPRA
jgi:exosortase H (IPTLxxWG-CTERM-specific)